MQKKTNDSVEQSKTRDFVKDTITNFDVYNAIIEQNYSPILNSVAEEKDYTSSTYTVLKDIISGGIGMGGTIVGLIATGGTATAAKIGFSLISTTFNLFMDLNKPSDSATKIWLKIRDYVKEYVGDTLTNDNFNRLMSELNGCKDSVSLYLDYRKKADPAALFYCRAAIAIFTQRISSFQQKEYEVVSLPLFVQVARLHLLLYRDLVLFGESWGVSAEDCVKDKLQMKKLIQKYTQYAHETYEKGLKNKQADTTPKWEYPCDCSKIDEENNGVLPLTKQWNAINKYKQGMQLSVLDIVAQYPILDPEIYPLGTQLKQSREVYAPIIGAILNKKDVGTPLGNIQVSTVEEIDRLILNKYEGELIDVRIEGGKLDTPPSIPEIPVIYKTQQIVDKMMDVVNMKEYDTRFKISDKGKEKKWFPSSHIIPLDFVGACCHPEMGVLNNIYMGNSLLDISPSDKPCSINPQNHKLSSIHLFGKFIQSGVSALMQSSGLICGFRQKELSPKHLVSPNQITQIPTEMTANNGYRNFSAEFENITGQNVMTAKMNNAYLLYNVFGIENATYQGKIRLYLSFKGTENSSISIEVCNDPTDVNPEWKITSIPLESTEKNPNAIKGKQGFYILTKSVDIDLTMGRNTIKLVYNNSNNINNQVYIDRIEIIPEKIKTNIAAHQRGVTFTTHMDGKLEASTDASIGNVPIDGPQSNKKWRVFVSGKDTGYSFDGKDTPNTIVTQFNDKFKNPNNGWQIPGNLLNVLDFTTDPTSQAVLTNENGKNILKLVKVNDENNDQLIMQIADDKISDTELKEKIRKTYNIFAGGKLVYRCKEDTMFKTVMDAFNGLNIKAYSARILEQADKVDRINMAKDIIEDLVLVNPSRSVNGKVKSNVGSYDTRVAKSALRSCKRAGLNIPDALFEKLKVIEEVVFALEPEMNGACYTTNKDSLDTMIIKKDCGLLQGPVLNQVGKIIRWIENEGYPKWYKNVILQINPRSFYSGITQLEIITNAYNLGNKEVLPLSTDSTIDIPLMTYPNWSISNTTKSGHRLQINAVLKNGEKIAILDEIAPPTSSRIGESIDEQKPYENIPGGKNRRGVK